MHFSRRRRYRTVIVGFPWDNRDERADFELHQAVESAWSCDLLTLTDHPVRSRDLKFVCGLPEDRDCRMVCIWPRSHQRFTVSTMLSTKLYVAVLLPDDHQSDAWPVELVSEFGLCRHRDLYVVPVHFMPKVTRGYASVPKTGRSSIGIVAGFTSGSATIHDDTSAPTQLDRSIAELLAGTRCRGRY